VGEYIRIGSMITVGTGGRSYVLSREQAEFLIRLARRDIEYFDKMRRERASTFYRRIFKLRRKGLISLERGFPYRLSKEGERVVKILEKYLGDEL